MKKTKRRIEYFSFYDHTRVKAHLEHLSEAGWVVEQIGSFFWRYRRVEPKKRGVSITYLPSGSDLNPQLSDEEEDFKSICERVGWRLACSWMQMQIFYHEDPDAQPVETDPELFVDTVHRSMRKNFLPSCIILTLLMLVYVGMGIRDFRTDPISLLSDNNNLAIKASLILLEFHLLFELLLYTFWRRKAKRAAVEEERFLPVPKWYRANQYLLLTVLGLDALFFVGVFLDSRMRQIFIPLIIVAVLSQTIPRLLQQVLKKRGWSSAKNRVVTALLAGGIMFVGLMFCGFRIFADIRFDDNDPRVVETYEFKGETYSRYDDELPLTVEDLVGIEETDEWSKKRVDSRSIFMESTAVHQSPRMDHLGQGLPRLEYDIYDIPSDFLYEHCRNALLKYPNRWIHSSPYYYEPLDPVPWQAEEAYMVYREGEPRYEYLICWEGRLLQIEFDNNELTPEHIFTIVEKLK